MLTLRNMLSRWRGIGREEGFLLGGKRCNLNTTEMRDMRAEHFSQLDQIAKSTDQLKQQVITRSPRTTYGTVYGAGGELPPCLGLVTECHRYLFNCGEAVPRFTGSESQSMLSIYIYKKKNLVVNHIASN